MAVMIGSARIDERGSITGGTAGDQKQTSSPDYRGEVSQQEFYPHKKGWLVIRPKSANHADRIAEKMITACNNKNLGYDQNGRLGVIALGVSTQKPIECDCSSLVRECVKEATGKDPGNFNTEGEAKALEATGLFEKPFKYTSGTKLYTGDILVTCTKGHTVIVTQGAIRSNAGTAATSSSSTASSTFKVVVNETVLSFQIAANKDGFRDASGRKLEEDGICGAKTKEVMRKVLLYAEYNENKKSYSVGSKGNLVKWWQKICKNKYNQSIEADGQFGRLTREATVQVQRKIKVCIDGKVGYSTISGVF